MGAERDYTGRIVLIAEDNALNLTLAKAIATRSLKGCRVVTASDGDKAVSAFEEERPDLILMDLQMPVTDGLEATRRIRALEAKSGARVPIVALSGSAAEEEAEACTAAGIDGFLEKPIDATALIAIAERWLPV